MSAYKLLVSAVHEDMKSTERGAMIRKFSNMISLVLITTDAFLFLASSLFDAPHTINYDLPRICQNYLYRTGQSGLHKSEKRVINLLTLEGRQKLRDIESLLNLQLTEKAWIHEEKIGVVHKFENMNLRNDLLGAYFVMGEWGPLERKKWQDLFTLRLV